jgi:hypothetical protein
MGNPGLITQQKRPYNPQFRVLVDRKHKTVNTGDCVQTVWEVADTFVWLPVGDDMAEKMLDPEDRTMWKYDFENEEFIDITPEPEEPEEVFDDSAEWQPDIKPLSETEEIIALLRREGISMADLIMALWDAVAHRDRERMHEMKPVIIEARTKKE